MWRLSSALALSLFLVDGGPAPPDGPTCEEAFPAIHAWVYEHLSDSQSVRDQMIARLDVLLERHGDDGSECVANAWFERVTVTNHSRRYEETVATTTAFLSGRTFRRLPVAEARMYRDRGLALNNLGRTVEAGQAYVAAAALVPRLPAATAAATLQDLADQAASQGDWAVAVGAHRRAMRILRDSLQTDPAGIRLRIGRLLANHAYLLQQLAEREWDPERRRRLARRLLAAADTAVAIVGGHRTDNPTEAAFDQGLHAFALIDGAYAAAVLGRHADAANRIGVAPTLITPEVQVLYPFALSDVWLRRAETERLAGRLDAAARAATTARATCATTEDGEYEAAALESMARIAEEAGRLDEARAWYREAIALRDIEWERSRLQDWSASAFAEMQAPYRGLTRVLVREGRPAEAFAVLDGARARSLRDLRARLALHDGLIRDR